MNETITHECFSENVLLVPRISRQLVASENQKSIQNSRHICRVAHDSNKIARNRLDTSQIKPQRRGTRYFCFASIYFHYHMVRTNWRLVKSSTCDNRHTRRGIECLKIMLSKLKCSLPELRRSQILRARK